ncbi:thioredoxin reductase (NADPH) [Motilibacter peucedani]|uniref:Thioredoxin reductase (NADPH) n=1 Tax=Motilibacter peucedani TaxID=598650 RepID=A0A420XRU6_9ACTN|nr:NAD(P)/FAD-dependent oxidoreductase [Motilibacter peucedani]RKS77608.1 thioredoxin reductase (NADPH) [Motilibacter peucedani]
MDEYDVVVVGGGAAGLSGALALVRSRRSVLVLDGQEPRNAPAGHVHNYLGREGTPPQELLATGRSEVEAYGGTVTYAVVRSAELVGDRFVVTTAERQVRARRLLVATGLVDRLPDVPGLQERWGRDVLHCPYCHGWEVRDQRIGILATGPVALHHAQLFRQLSPHVTLLLHGTTAPAPEESEQLAARGIPVVEGPVEELVVRDDRLTGVRLSTGQVVELNALAVAPRFEARTLPGLGLATEDLVVNGHVLGSAVPADPTGATGVPGVWVAGNVTNLMAQVIASAAQGLTAGAAINADLVAEDVRSAVAARQAA